MRALPTGMTIVPDGAALVERAAAWWEGGGGPEGDDS
jgi:hypothetical protein